jgi:hypothetical protein
MPVSAADLRESYSANQAYTPLMPVIIDRALLEASRKWSPLGRVFARKTWQTLQYQFNQRNALPSAQFTTKNPSAGQIQYSQSTFVPGSYDIKHTEVDLSIAKLDQQVAVVNGSVYDLELAGAGESMKRLEDMTHIWGNANATLASKRPQWNGIDQQIAMNTNNRQDGGNNVVSLGTLDNLYDAVRPLVAQDLTDDFAFVMPSTMQTKINSLLTNQVRYNKDMVRIFARDDYGDPNAQPADNYLDAGVEVATYRSVPLIFSSFMESVGSMTTVTGAAGGSGAVLPASTYYYEVEAVTRYGVTYASAEVTVTTTSGQSATLTWTTPAILDPFLNVIDVLSYRVYRGSASGGESLYAVVSAYDASDAAIVTFVDNGAPSVPIANQSFTNLYTTVATNTNGTQAVPDGLDFPRFIASAGQKPASIYLVPRNPDFALIPVLNEMTPVVLAPTLARSSQFALIADMTLALRAGAFAAKVDRIRSA